jgi:hypothetical protein
LSIVIYAQTINGKKC